MEPAFQANEAIEAGLEKGGLVSEARTGKRFPLELPIKIHGMAQGGVTGNMSAAGVYIRGNPALDIGSNVEFEIALPPELTGGNENVVVQCKGRVVRKDGGQQPRRSRLGVRLVAQNRAERRRA